MTTNHRPQLESKRGRDIAIKNTIQHARAQPGQTKLKIRSDITGAHIGERAGKRALEELEGDNKKLKLLDSKHIQTETVRDGSSVDSAKIPSGEDGTSNAENDPDHSGNDSENQSNHSNASASESESEDDTDALLAELAKTRDENKAHRETKPARSKDAGAKRSWRSKTAFSRNTGSAEKFTTDTIKSKAHQKFLSDFIR